MTGAEHSTSPEQVMAYLDGELAPERAREVLAHLAGCEACRQIADDLRGVSQQISTWSVESPPPSFRLPDANAVAPQVVRRPFWRRPAVWVAAPAVAVVVLAAIGDMDFFATRKAMAPPRSTAPAVEARGQVVSRGGVAGTPTGTAMAISVGGQADPSRGPLIARTARLKVLVDSIDASRPALERIVRDVNGFIGDIAAGGEESRWVHATLRVPADKLDATMNAVRQLGKVLEESQQGEDVTEQSVDINARISNGRRTEQRLVQLLGNRTGSLEDVLAVERELARIRTELEQLDTARKNLDRRVTYATVRVEITEQARPAVTLGPTSLSTRLRNAVVEGTRTAMQSVVGFLLFAIEVGPTLLVWALLLALPARYAMRWWRRRESAAA